MDPKKVCPVCFYEAPEGSKHYTHYGAICCFSCKAFFRRLHRENLVESLECKTGGNCDLMTGKRTACKKCRYLQCLVVGLNPAKVLMDEEERKRFSHPKKKQHKLNVWNELEPPPLIEENQWITEHVEHFTQICKKIKPDSQFFLKNLQLRFDADPQTFQEVNGIMFNVWSHRFHLLLSDCFNNNLKLQVRTELAESNFQMGVLVQLVQYDFGQHANYKAQLESLMGNENLDMNSLTCVRPISLTDAFPDFPNKWEYKEIGAQLASFLRRPEVAILILLNFLLNGCQNKEVQQLQQCFFRLLLKKLHEYPEYQAWQEPEHALSHFFGQMNQFVGLLQVFLASGMQGLQDDE